MMIESFLLNYAMLVVFFGLGPLVGFLWARDKYRVRPATSPQPLSGAASALRERTQRRYLR